MNTLEGSYRIAQLGGLPIFRVERWTKRWWCRQWYWKPVTFIHSGYGGPYRVTQFDSAEEACRNLDILRANNAYYLLHKQSAWRAAIYQCPEQESK